MFQPGGHPVVAVFFGHARIEFFFKGRPVGFLFGAFFFHLDEGGQLSLRHFNGGGCGHRRERIECSWVLLGEERGDLREHLKIQVEQVGIQNTVFGEGAAPGGGEKVPVAVIVSVGVGGVGGHLLQRFVKFFGHVECVTGHG